MRRGIAWRLAVLGIVLATPARSERIRSFDVVIDVGANGSFTVEERIRWDFEGASKHGIYREIPIAYERPGSADYRIDVRVDRVTDAQGTPWPMKTSRAGGYLRIRVGDPERTLTGQQDYWFRYRVGRGLLFFPDHDELYWNATGTEWAFPIERAEAHVTVPPVGDRRIELACYTGPVGSREHACEIHQTDTAVDAAAGRRLGPREGLTIVVGLPKGVVTEPTALQRRLWWLLDSGVAWLALPVIALAGMLTRWRRGGRDPVVQEAVPVRYEPPPGLTPAEVGTVFDERADLDDVTSTILDLAIRGWLRIEEMPAEGLLFFSRTDYKLVRLPDPAGARLKSHEAELLAGLFEGNRKSVRISELRDKFHRHLPPIKRALYEELSAKDGLFAADPDRVRQRHLIAGFLLAVPGVFVLQPFGPIACASFVFAGIVVAMVGRGMPRRTRKGREAYEHIVGLREFIRRVEGDRLDRFGGRTAGTFEKVLPFAVVLGVADRWANAFSGIYATPPSWYQGRFDGGTFQADDLVRHVGRSLDTMGRTLASTPSGGSGSSGLGDSGSSGGGFGGGGGGSW